MSVQRKESYQNGRRRNDRDRRMEIRIRSTPPLIGEVLRYRDGMIITSEVKFAVLTEVIEKIKSILNDEVDTNGFDRVEVRIWINELGTDGSRGLSFKLFGRRLETEGTKGEMRNFGFIRRLNVAEDKIRQIKLTIFVGVEDFLTRMKEAIAQLKSITSENSEGHERNLRYGGDATIRHLEPLLNMYVLLMKRTVLIEAYEILLNGSFTYQSVVYGLTKASYRLKSIELVEAIKTYELRSASITVGGERGDSAREIITICDLESGILSQSLTKDIRVKIFKNVRPKEVKEVKNPSNRQAVKVLKVVGVESTVDLTSLDLELAHRLVSKSQVEAKVNKGESSSSNESTPKKEVGLLPPTRSKIVTTIKGSRSSKEMIKSEVKEEPFSGRIQALLMKDDPQSLNKMKNILLLILKMSIDEMADVFVSNGGERLAKVQNCLKILSNGVAEDEVYQELADYVFEGYVSEMMTKFYVSASVGMNRYEFLIGLLMFIVITNEVGFEWIQQIYECESSALPGVWREIFNTLKGSSRM